MNIQKLQSIKPSGKEYHLVTLMALREAGERHHDLNGGDPDLSVKASGHSKEMKARYDLKSTRYLRESIDIERAIIRANNDKIEALKRQIAANDRRIAEIDRLLNC